MSTDCDVDRLVLFYLVAGKFAVTPGENDGGPWALFLFKGPRLTKQSELQSLIDPVVSGLDYELVGVEYVPQGRHSVLRIYIDTPDGVTLDDCEKVSRQVSALLDVEDPIHGEYVLEVSSPGLDRPLFTEAHFLRFLGEKSTIRMKHPMNGRRKFSGILKAVENGNVAIIVDGETFEIPLDEIEKANLVPQF